MKKIWFSFLLSWIFLAGVSMAKDNAVVCTMEYAPVCAEVQVQCIKAPCPAIKETFGNKCMMNANKLAKFLYKWECEKDKTKKECPEYSAPAPGFCSGGKIVDWGKDENWCQNPPICIEKIDLNKCESYFDGCNNCSVKDWKIEACTEMYCEKPTDPKCLKYKEPLFNMANPASKFCIENSGDLKILDWTWWQYGICEFVDWSKCEERAFFRWKCKPEYKKIHSILNKYFEKYANKFSKLEDKKLFLENFKFQIQSFSKWAKLWLQKTYNKIIQAIDLYY